MSKVIIKADTLKPQALNATGRQEFNIDEFIYIKSFNYDDNNAIKVRFYVLLKTSETEFNMIDDITYSIADGKAFSDKDGFKVYKRDANGDIMYQDVEVESVDEDGETITTVVQEPIVRDDDFTRNFVAFAALIIPSVFADVNNFLGYHENEKGAIDKA